MEEMRGQDVYREMIAITERKLVKGDFLEQLQRILTLRPKALILREKDLDEASYAELARKVIPLCRQDQVPCFLHSGIRLAEKLECRCLHLPFRLLMETKADADTEGVSLSAPGILKDPETGRLCGPFAQISVSCHSLEEAKAAEKSGASQIVLGTIFETSCKPGRKGAGLEFLREVCREVRIPVYAIGGITPEHLPLLKEAGAAGGCMMSGFMQL